MYVNTKGKRKGEKCGRSTKGSFCTTHRKMSNNKQESGSSMDDKKEVGGIEVIELSSELVARTRNLDLLM